jgi:hypothetical protein
MDKQALDRKLANDDWMKRHVTGLSKVLIDKHKMLDRHLTRAKATCPLCGVKDRMQLSLAANRRDISGYHIRWWCDCGFQGME